MSWLVYFSMSWRTFGVSGQRACALQALVVAACGLVLTVEREVRHALEVANDAREVVQIVRVAVRTFLQVLLGDVPAVAAQRVGTVEGKIVAPPLRRSSWRYWGCVRCSSRFMCCAEPPVR